jgi:hypothetical protein
MLEDNADAQRDRKVLDFFPDRIRCEITAESRGMTGLPDHNLNCWQ